MGLIGVIALFALGLSLRVAPPVPGAVATNQPTEPFYFQGGSTGKSVRFISTTTVACLIQNPSNATTTFSARWDVPVSTTTTTVLNLATSTNSGRFATSSTAILATTIAANAKGSASWVGTTNTNILGPGEWVQVGYGAGTTLPTTAQQQTGTCSVSFANIY
jgi:hypothetical protein